MDQPGAKNRDATLYATLESAHLPFAVLMDADLRFVYANPAFCRMAGKTAESLFGKPMAQVLPNEVNCLRLLDRVYRNGVSESHTDVEESSPDSLLQSYEAWPTWEPGLDRLHPAGAFLQVTETAQLHRRTADLNQALLMSSLRQHELLEETASLNSMLISEIEERRRAEQEIVLLAHHDALTNIPNRRLLMDRLHQATLACSRTLAHGAVVFIDLDRFKTLNDTHGHHVGDLLLQQTALRLREGVRESDTVARLGGDEFVLLLEHLSPDDQEAISQASSVAAKIVASLCTPHLLGEYLYRGSGSLGIAMFGKDRVSAEALLTRADMAQYKAKSSGGSTYFFYDQEMYVSALSQAALKADLRFAAERRQLRLYYQPQVDKAGQIVGYEALLRWLHPDRGLLASAEFIVTAEEHGTMETIGVWVVETACEQLVRWGAQSQTSHLMLSINISSREFDRSDFADTLLKTLDNTGANPRRLVLELTERTMFRSTAEVVSKMMALRTRGIQFSLDDFGVGFSSLSSLRCFPVSQLKLDCSFVADILSSSRDQAIADAVIALGKSLQLTVVAECIESEQQKQLLQQYGCEVFQGFLFGRPRPWTLENHICSL
jgi:diguanylate cyclase (GGDEF)-like protein